MRFWVQAAGLTLIGVHLSLLLALGLGRVQAVESSMLAYMGRYQGVTHTYLLDVPRQQSVRLSHSGGETLFNPVWSPDGQLLAYAEPVANDKRRITILDLETSQTQLLPEQNAWGPSWRLNAGGQLAYISLTAGNVQIFDVEQGQAETIFGDSLDLELSWSPDGDSLLIVSQQAGNREIYLLNPDEDKLLNITNHAGEDFQPAWSPDGDWVAFTSDRNRRNYEIYIVDRNGENLRNVTRSISEDWNPAWSPDGRSLAFVGSVYGNYQIYLTDLDIGVTRNLTQSASNELSPAWSADGRLMAFVSNRDGWRQIYLMDADGKNQRPLVTGAAEYFAPVWRPILPPGLSAD